MATATFTIGDFVEVHSLVSEAGVALNGQNGYIVGRNEATGRWCVSFQNSSLGKQLKACNLRPVPATATEKLRAANCQNAKAVERIGVKAEGERMSIEKAVGADEVVNSMKGTKLRPDRVEVLGAGHCDANGSYIWTTDRQRYYKESGRDDGDYYTISPPGIWESRSQILGGNTRPRDGFHELAQHLNQMMLEEWKQNARNWTLRLLSQFGSASDVYVAPGSAAEPPPESGWGCTRSVHQPPPTLRLW